MPKQYNTIQEQFFKYVSMEPMSGCWLWTGGCTNKGYSVMRIRRISKHTILSHRISYELFNGEIPKGMCVLHHCDTPECVNPHHLFLGSIQDNSDDCVIKGRQAKGTKVKNSKLTEQQVIDIINSKEKQNYLAKQYNVVPTTIWWIKHGKNWKHLQLDTSL